jgi:hypothetical protein
MTKSSSVSLPDEVNGRVGPPRPAPRGQSRRPSRPATRALVASVSARPPTAGGPTLASLVAACEQTELVDLAISQGVVGRASERLGPLLEPAQRSKLLEQVRLEAVRHMGYLGLLDRSGKALNEAEVPWAVLKGPVLAELSYQQTTRGYSDLDLLVPAAQFATAIRALEAVGLVLAQRNWPVLVKGARGQLTMRNADQSVDLHWHLVWKWGTRERFLLACDEMLARRRRASLGGISAWALEPTDFAAHVALHACLAGAHQLRWLVDIERTVTNQPPDWDVLIRRCRAWRVGLPVSVALSRARQSVGAPVPERVTRELAGGNLNRLLASQLDHWSPGGHMPGGRSAGAGLTRALGDNPLSTPASFASETWESVIGFLRPEPAGTTNPRSLGYDSGGPEGREHFIEMVGTADRYGHISKQDLRRLVVLRG